MKHRVINSAFDFTTYPLQISTNIPTNVNWSANSSGSAIGNSGSRWWDTNILSASGEQLVDPNSPLTLPFLATNLPDTLFDAIIKVVVNGTSYPQGISNSPDNDGVYLTSPTTTDKKIFWTDLYCFGLSNSIGNSATHNNYMFGGEGLQVGGSKDINVYFDSPLTENISLSYSIQYYRYSSGLFGLDFTGTSELIAGQQSYLLANRNFSLESYNAGFGSLSSVGSGFFKVSLSTNNSSYRSLLPYYHWGLA